MTTTVTHLLVPVSKLEAHASKIKAATAKAMAKVIKSTPAGETALRYYLLFSDPERVARAGLDPLPEDRLFYNRYFWFKRFEKLHAAKYGFDAGIEQMASMLLENAHDDVDFSLVEAVQKQAME